MLSSGIKMIFVSYVDDQIDLHIPFVFYGKRRAEVARKKQSKETEYEQ